MVPGEENRLEENRDNAKECRGLACNRQRPRDPQLCRQLQAHAYFALPSDL
jgi:hypothetical protein